MNAPEHIKRKRLTMIQLIMTVCSMVSALHGSHDQGMIRMAIRLGAYQRKPFDVTDLATVTGYARTTVLRHLTELERVGTVKLVRVGRRTIPVLANPTTSREADDFYKRVELLVKDAAFDLSEMDSSLTGQSPANNSTNARPTAKDRGLGNQKTS